jgi:two-component system cell cycle sensor histidine kinase/response regulator CckA
MSESNPLRLVTHVDIKKVLVLEDDELVSKFIKMALESKGMDVVSVANGVEGIHAIKNADFEAIICDMMMPKLPGDMFYLAVERIKPHLCPRFIFISGYKDDPKITEFMKKVNGALLVKPFKMDDLLEMMAFIQIRPHM